MFGLFKSLPCVQNGEKNIGEEGKNTCERGAAHMKFEIKTKQNRKKTKATTRQELQHHSSSHTTRNTSIEKNATRFANG